MKNKYVLLGGGVVALALIIILVVMIIPKGDKIAETPLFYVTENDELKFLFFNYKEPVTLADESDGYTSYETRADQKRMLYTNDDNLYEINLTKKKDNTEKIANDVAYDFGYSDDGKYIYYVNDDGNLYAYNNKEKIKLDSDVYGVNKTFLDYILYEKDDIIYLRSFDKKKDEKVKLGGNSNLHINEDNSKILYTTSGKNGMDVYIYSIKSKEKEKIIKDVDEISYVSKSFDKIVFVRENESQIDLKELLFSDTMYEEDNNSDMEYIYESYFNDEYYYGDDYNKVVVSEDVYEAYQAKEKRDEIRYDIDDELDYYSGDTNDIYVYENNKETKLVTDVYSVANVKTDSKVEILYRKLSFTGEKLDISTMEEEDVSEQIDKLQMKMFYAVGDDEGVEILSKDADDAYGYIKNKRIYISLENDDYEEDLYVFTKGKKIIDSKEKIADDVEDYSFVDEESDDLIYVDNVKKDKGDLILYSNGKKTTIAEDMSGNFNIYPNGDIFYYSNYDSDEGVGDYYVYSKGRSTLLVEDVNYVYSLDKKRSYVLKDCSEKSDTCDLYKLENKKLKLIEYGIADIM